jgi:hypothetical protein
MQPAPWPAVIRPIEDWFGLRPRITSLNRLIETDLSDSRHFSISQLRDVSYLNDRLD